MYQTIKMHILFIRNFDARNYTYWKDIKQRTVVYKENRKSGNYAIVEHCVYALKRILRVVERTESSDPVQVFVLFFFILEAYG